VRTFRSAACGQAWRPALHRNRDGAV